MIVVIDYGLGNIRSVSCALQKIGADIIVSSKPDDLEKAKGVVLPGVGAFKKAMENIKRLDLLEPLKNYLGSSKPYLGICLGMQLLFQESYEHGRTQGFGVLEGVVKRFSPEVKIPHMGWNQVCFSGKSNMFSEIDSNSYFYFDHSYYVIPGRKGVISGTTDYGIDFASAVEAGNIWAVQFHPEKSSEKGLKIMESFLRQC